LLAAAAVKLKEMILETENLFGEKKQEQYKPERESLQKELSLIFNEYFTIEQLVNYITNDFYETLEYHQLCFGLSSCQKTSLLFNPHRLDTKAGKSKLSCFEALKDYNFLNGLSRMILHERKQKGDNYKSRYGELLYQILAFNINGVQYVNEIHPIISRDLALKYCNGLNSKVLDPCAGWGGRMIGFSTVVSEYYSFEPYTKTYNGLREPREYTDSRTKKAFGRNKDNSVDLGYSSKDETRLKRNVWRYFAGGGANDKIASQHPAIFPEQLANDHILSWTNEGDLVYDCFMGSGTVAKMSILNNRNWIGSEISNEYCNIIEERIKKAWEEKRKEKDLGAGTLFETE
jgi:hypothetical protein